MPSIVMPVADWAPDQAPFLNAAHPVAKNTYPRPDGSDGPLDGPVELSDALGAKCMGAFTARDKTGQTYVFAGTETGLYLQSATTWTDVSAATYGAAYNWQFAQFGELVIATNFNDEVQKYTLGGAATFSILNSAAPIARYVAAVEPGFVVLGFYDDSTVESGGVWWSAINDATQWPTPGGSTAISVESDNQQLPTGGAITGILPAIGGASAASCMERAVYRMQYAGAPVVFSFSEVAGSRGYNAP